MIPLDLATLDQLFDEVKSRFTDCIITGRRVVDKDEEVYAYKRGHKGTYESVVFLLSHTEWCLHDDYAESEHDPEPWEEL